MIFFDFDLFDLNFFEMFYKKYFFDLFVDLSKMVWMVLVFIFDSVVDKELLYYLGEDVVVIVLWFDFLGCFFFFCVSCKIVFIKGLYYYG